MLVQADAASLHYDASSQTQEDIKAAVVAMQKLRSWRGVDEGFAVQAELLSDEENPMRRLQLAAQLFGAWRSNVEANTRSSWASMPVEVAAWYA